MYCRFRALSVVTYPIPTMFPTNPKTLTIGIRIPWITYWFQVLFLYRMAVKLVDISDVLVEKFIWELTIKARYHTLWTIDTRNSIQSAKKVGVCYIRHIKYAWLAMFSSRIKSLDLFHQSSTNELDNRFECIWPLF